MASGKWDGLAGWCLSEFAGVVGAPGGFGAWRGGEEVEPGVVQMPWFELSPQAAAFVDAAYDRGWVRQGVSWTAWSETARGRRLLQEPAALAGASEDEVAAVLTALVRGERFGDGTLLDGVRRGVLAAALRRIPELAAGRTTLVVERLDGGPRLVVERADRLAAWYFGRDAASVGAFAFDDYAGTGDPDRIVDDDITAINRTMRARSPHAVWAEFAEARDPLPWLRALPRDLSLFDIDAESWASAWADRVAAPVDALMGPRRNLAVVTKVLHAKRPRLYPVLDSLVVQLVGGSGRPPRELLDHVRRVGRMNEPTLRLVGRQLRAGEPSRRRTRVRILDGILWTAHPGTSLGYEPGMWERRVAPSPAGS